MFNGVRSLGNKTKQANNTGPKTKPQVYETDVNPKPIL